MTNLQAAVGVSQLESIDKILKRRKFIENKYNKKLNFFCLEVIPGPTKPLLNREEL